MNSSPLIIFVKAPRVGAVKTRLGKSIGAEAACAAYRKMVAQLVARLSDQCEVILRFTPDDARAEIEPWLQPGWRAAPQGPGDLGARLMQSFAEAFAQGAQRVIVIGSDCPSVTSNDIEAAKQSLATHDVALGPARDGGYWLIGLRRSQDDLFEDMAWSTDTVLNETLRRADQAELRVQQLRELSDIDTAADWCEFLAGRS